MQRKKRTWWLPYAVAAVAIVAATVLCVAAVPPNASGALFSIFFGAITYVAWYGGLWPTFFATALSYLAANWFILQPRDQFTLNGTLLAYFFVCLSIGLFSEAMKRALRRKEDSAQHISSILESMPDGFIALDAQWRVTYMNPPARHLDRLARAGEAAEATWNRFPPTAGATAEAKLRLAAAARRAVDFEHCYEPWARWFEVKASPGPRGGLVVYFRDITERKAIEDEQRKLAMIVDSSEDAIIGIDLEGKIMNWNIGAEHLYGYRPDEVLGRSVTLLAPPGHVDEESDILSKVVREERIVHFDTVRLAKSGRKIHVSLSVSPIKDANGRIIGAAKIARDISARKRAEALLREADRRKDDFLAVLGHELRNPLAGIVNGVQILNYIDSLPPDVIEIRGLIERQATQMKRLIDDLLDVSRIARGKVTLRTEPLDLTHLVSQLAADYRTRLAEEDLELAVAVPEVAICVLGDPARLSQVLANLLDNAVKFSDKGRGAVIHVSVTTEDDQAVVTVRDSGLGFSPEVKATLFEPFAQAEATLAQSPEGLGLGLALVRGLVELHGGTVEAESDGPGTGSTFAIRIPLADVPHAPATVRANGSQPFASCRSLVIEDNRDVSRSIVRILELNGHQVAAAGDGPSGVELARRLLPEVVFCDIGLPGEMDGYGVARALRADPSTSSAYLVAVTGFGQEEDRRRAIEAGFDRHLMKPADHAEILALAAEVAAARLTPR